MTTTTDRRAVGALRPHPDNQRIYGDGADEALVASVRVKGVLAPLLITAQDQIISGHRRWDAARTCGLADVPVVVFPSTDELDILEALLEANQQRTKDGEQVGREYEAAKLVEAERAKRRQGTRTDLVVNSPPSARAPKGKAGDLAAKRIGVSRQKGERASAVTKVVDALKEKGMDGEAERLRRALKTQSVNKAYQETKRRGYDEYVQPRLAVESAPLERPGLGNLLLTLPTWLGLTSEQQREALARPPSGATFNAQTNTDIEWAQWSWNPVTGCKHDCSYCYARDIAERSEAFPQKFVPTFLPERLGAPRRMRVPEKAAHDVAFRNVFTCSMADLFGKWVPADWIEAVLDAVRGSPQWNFLFLTKFPVRLQEFNPFPDNAWVGTTVDAQARVRHAERVFEGVEARVKWLSCEPLLEPLRFARLDLFEWVVIGGASASTQTPEFRPPRAWVHDLERQALEAGCQLYEKDNLRLREYPGQSSAPPISVPDAFKMGYLQRDVLEPETYAAEVAS